MNAPLLIEFALVGLWYGLGVRRLWRKAGVGHGIRRWQTVALAGGLVALAIALASPLDTLSVQLFSAHMVQHTLLILIAAPLLVASGFPIAALWALPRRWAHITAFSLQQMSRLRIWWRFVNRFSVSWLIFAGSLWLWHLPGFYQAALSSGAIHALEHLTFLAASGLFWWMLFKPTHKKHIRYGIGVLYLFTTGLQTSALGALLVFARQPWYPDYAAGAVSLGVLPLDDQQLAGLIMWLPGGVLYTIASALCFMAWLNAFDHETSRRAYRAPTEVSSEGVS